ncbi:MAG: hypothetical protein IPG50_06355 [Myxococcales bacterium]|nr:hypothetical protein [Myxococcales bacterium]
MRLAVALGAPVGRALHYGGRVMEAFSRLILRLHPFVTLAISGGCFLSTSVSGLSGGSATSDAGSAVGAEAGHDAVSIADADGGPIGSPDDGATDAAPQAPLFELPVVLAPAQFSPRSLALDADDVVWMNTAKASAAIARATRRPAGTQGSALTVYAGAVLNDGIGLVLTPGGVFWSCITGEHSVCTAAKTGATFNVVSTESSGVGKWASGVAYGATLYLASSTGIASIPTDLSAPAVKLEPSVVTFPVADASSLYFLQGSQVSRMAKAGSPSVIDVVAGAQVGVRGLVLDASRLYWVVDSGNVLAIDKGASAGAPLVLASGQSGPSSVAIDSGYVYWANAADGTIARVAKGGGPVVTIAQGQVAPSQLVADDAGLAWVNANGDVVGMRRK